MKIYINLKPSSNGGPGVFVQKFSKKLESLGYSVEYEDDDSCDFGFFLVNSGNLGPKFKSQGKPFLVRSGGFYIKEFWDGSKGRVFTPEMEKHNSCFTWDIKNANHIVYQSEWLKKIADQELSERSENFSIIHNGVDLELFKPYDLRSNQEIKLLVYGNLRRPDIVNISLKAFDYLRKENNVSISFLGYKDSEVEAILNSQRKDSRIHVLDPVENEALPSIISNYSIVLAPTQGDFCPNVVVESLACGIPCVVAEWGGTRELIYEGGITVSDYENWGYTDFYAKQFYLATKKICKNLKYYQLKAREVAQKYHSLDSMTEKYLEVINKYAKSVISS